MIPKQKSFQIREVSIECSTESIINNIINKQYYVIVKSGIQCGDAIDTKNEAEIICKWLNRVYGS